MSSHYQINTPSVIGEILDGEAIIVNLDSGAYYSLRGVGANCWSLLEQGATKVEIIEHICAAYDGESAQITKSVSELLGQIEAEALIRPLDSPPAESNPAPQLISTNERKAFTPPILEKFTDMADLLLLDPIHEVDESAGWPTQR